MAKAALQQGKPTSGARALDPRYSTITFAGVSIGATIAAAYTGAAMQTFYLFYGIAILALVVSAATSAAMRFPASIGRIKTLPVLLCVAALARVAALFGTLRLSVDLTWYGDYLQFISSGLHPYTNFYFPYPQGFALIITAFAHGHLGLPALHLFFIAADVASVYGVYILSGAIGNEQSALRSASLYALLPMAILESGSSGHFDALAAFAALLVLYFSIRRRPTLAASFLAIGAAIKVFPLALAPALVYAVRRRSDLLKAAIAFFVITILTIAALGRSGLGALNFYASGGYGSAPARIYIESFLSNSLPRLIHDLPVLGAIIPFAEILVAFSILAAAVLGLRPLAENAHDGFERTIQRLSAFNYGGIATGGLCLILLAYGAYTVLSPGSDLYMAYSWWTPQSVTVLRGLAMFGFAAIALYEAVRWSFRTEPPAVQIVNLMGALLCTLILLKADVNTWYVVPAAALFCASQRRAVAIPLVAALSMYWVAWPSSSFAASDYFSPVVLAGPNATVVALRGVGSAERTIALPVRHLSANNALAFSVASDYDPTLGHQPASLTVRLQGLDARGRSISAPILVRYASATRQFTISQRYVQWRFFPELKSLQNVTLKVRSEHRFSGLHEFRISQLRIVDEPYTDTVTVAIEGFGAATLFIFFIAFSEKLAAGRRQEVSPPLRVAD